MSPHSTLHQRSINQYIGRRSMFSSLSFSSTSACGIPLGPKHVWHSVLLPSARRSGSDHSLVQVEESTCFSHTFAQLSSPTAPFGKSAPPFLEFADATTAALACFPLPSPFFPFPFLPPLPLPSCLPFPLPFAWASSFLALYFSQVFSLSGSN